MSSDDGIDYYKSFKIHHNLKQQQHQHQQHSSKTPNHQPSQPSTQKPYKQRSQHSQTGQTGPYQSMSSISSTASSAVIGGSSGTQSQCSTMQRRKLSLNYQHQLQIGGECTLQDCPIVNGATNSPNRFSLSLQPQYDDQMMTCCLPPPSPAPASDRYVMGIPCPSSTVVQQQQQHTPAQIPTQTNNVNTCGGGGTAAISTSSSTISSSNSSYKFGSNSSSSLSSMNSSSLHRTMSPNSRLRMSDRFRSDASTPSYNPTYLSSNVHTPVKRYVPTPPPPNEMYPLEQQTTTVTAPIQSHHSSGSSTASSTSGYQTGGSTAAANHVNTLPYRFKMRCCINDQAATLAADHYATPPRVRPGGVGVNKCPSQQQQIGKISKLDQQRTPSVENIMNDPTGAAACLHCNTMRRTTGVHQTTQTTGPISPVPQNITNIMEVAIAGTPQSQTSQQPPPQHTPHTENTPTTTTPMSPQVQQQQQQQQNEIMQQQMIQQQQQRAFQQQVAAANRHHQHQLNLMNQQNASTAAAAPATATNYSTVHSNSQIQISSATPAITPQRSSRQPQNSSGTTTNGAQPRFTTTTISRKQKVKEYIRREIAKFFGVDPQTETDEHYKWSERQKRLAVRRFGQLKNEMDPGECQNSRQTQQNSVVEHPIDRPDILPNQVADHHLHHHGSGGSSELIIDQDSYVRLPIEKKASVPSMFINGLIYVVNTLNKSSYGNKQPSANRCSHTYKQQWSRSFAPAHVSTSNTADGENGGGDIYEGLTMLQEEEVFFDFSVNENGTVATNHRQITTTRQMYMSGERVHGWRTSAIIDQQNMQQHQPNGQQQQHQQSSNSSGGLQRNTSSSSAGTHATFRGNRISSQLLDGVLENSRRPVPNKIKLFHIHELDDRNDHRPFFTYWINTVQILILLLSLISYGIGPIGVGIEQKTGQVLVTSLSLQTVQHQEPRNLWIGPRSNDLVHLGAKFAACMRKDIKIMDVISKTKRQERETACCIRNDDSGCVQSSQADCSVRGLWPTKSISTWKKWSPGESGPGGRISGSVCGLDPKYCDAPASIAPYEWPDDITKWPICRKTNQFSQRFRFKDHTAEHMVCEVIGHPCCTGVYGECRITTKEYCDFVNGYFHEEASLCSQISCLNNVCGMFPFLSVEVPDQFYRLFTTLCLHAGVIHLAVTVTIQHIYLADLERLIGPIRTAIVYIGSGLAGTLTSAILVPYKPEVGPLASLAGVIASLIALLLVIHWKQLRKPHIALFKLILIGAFIFGMGTLPWQQNIAGLIAATVCGIFLTIALVPFVSITKYARKSKINLIWACMLFHFLMFTILFVIFMIIPTEMTSLNIGDVFSNGGSNIGDFGQTHHGSTNHHIQRINSNQGKNSPPQQPPNVQQGHHHPLDDLPPGGSSGGPNAGDYNSNRRTKSSNAGGGGGGAGPSNGGGHSLVSEISRSGNIITFNTNYVLRQHTNNSINSKLPHQQQQSKSNKKIRFQTLIDNIYKNDNRWRPISDSGLDNLTAPISIEASTINGGGGVGGPSDDEDDDIKSDSDDVEDRGAVASATVNGELGNNGFNSINKDIINDNISNNINVFVSSPSGSVPGA